MTRFLVDSDWIINALNGVDQALRVLDDLESGGLAISAISYAEVYEGAYYSRESAATLLGLKTFMLGKELIEPSLAILERFAIIRGGLPRQVRNQIGSFDLLIAATAIERGLTLLTNNLKHFRHVPELRIYALGESER